MTILTLSLTLLLGCKGDDGTTDDSNTADTQETGEVDLAALYAAAVADAAVADLRTPPGPRWPGRIADAGFFDETWK